MFCIDRVQFDHDIDGSPLRAETVAHRWRLVGHIEDKQGHALSGHALLEMTPTTLAARMKTMPSLPRVGDQDLTAAMLEYENARNGWQDCLVDVRFRSKPNLK